jgi:hypothetical protein
MGGNLLDPAVATISNGQLDLSVAANQLHGSEIQSLPGNWSYGYYEAS